MEHKIDILDKGHVTLIDSLGSDITIVNAARVSYGKKINELRPSDTKLIKFLVQNKHDSPFRHVYLQFRVKAPEFVMRQWYKHIVGITYTEQATVDHAWNENSGRYMEYEPEIYVPEYFRQQAASNAQASTHESAGDFAKEEYRQHIYKCFTTYKSLLDQGVAREQARLALPFGLYTEVVWTASLQATLNFILLRDHEGAQFEIREYAKAVREHTRSVCPIVTDIWENFRR
jgi:thymidylate synthase (FAD)